MNPAVLAALQLALTAAPPALEQPKFNKKLSPPIGHTHYIANQRNKNIHYKSNKNRPIGQPQSRGKK